MTTQHWPVDQFVSAAEVVGVPYTEFVARINQTNVLPGAHSSLSRLSRWSGLNESSTLLEVACTTGFSSRTISMTSGCAAVGFDISQPAIVMARFNAAVEAPACRLDYLKADGNDADFGRSFSHIIVGAALGFFSDPAASARGLTRWLDDGGYVLATPFWSGQPLPSDAARVRREVFGIASDMERRAEALRHFRGLDIVYHEDFELFEEEEEDIEHYCTSTIDRFVAQSGTDDHHVIEACRVRLADIRRATNILRRYQRYSVLVFQYSRQNYPMRFTELF